MGNFSNKTSENIAQKCNNKVICIFEANNFLHVYHTDTASGVYTDSEQTKICCRPASYVFI